MLHLCSNCEEPITNGQRVKVVVTATYHALKSTVAYALDKHDLEADASTLCHDQCHEGD